MKLNFNFIIKTIMALQRPVKPCHGYSRYAFLTETTRGID
jgi:hypothetical protein